MLFFPLVIMSVSNDDDRAFMKALYVKYRMNMYRMARALTSSEQDAKDVVSEACASLIKKITLLRRFDRNRLEGYIISTVKNAAFMLHRKRKRERREEALYARRFLPEPEPDPEETLLRECAVDELKHALGRLPEGELAVLRMKYIELLSDREIASALGIKEASVRSRLSRARQRLCEYLGGAPDNE